MIFYFFVLFVISRDTLKIAVLPAWELNSGELDRHFSVFLRFGEMLKNRVCTCLSFSCFFIIFGHFWKAFGVPLASFWSHRRLFGVLVSSFWLRLARLGCLWGLSARFLWCLWPVWAVCKLSLFLLNQFRGSFSCSFCVFYIACRVCVV